MSRDPHGTRSITRALKQARCDELIGLFQDAAAAWAKAQVGKDLRVLVDKLDGDDAIGRTEADALDIDGSVRLVGCAHLTPGTELLATVVAADAMELVAQPSTSAAAVRYFAAGPVAKSGEGS
jgi:ribosomal protein S12 methylthiotransferase